METLNLLLPNKKELLRIYKPLQLFVEKCQFFNQNKQ